MQSYYKSKADGKNNVDNGNKQETKIEKNTSNYNKR